MRQLWLLLLVVGVQIPRPLPPASPASPASLTPRISIEGTVIRGRTNEPIASVRVTLRPSGISTVTDLTGKFRLEAPAGRYTLLALQDGFVLQRDSAHGVTELGMVLSLNAGQTLNNVLLSMVALPAISGHTYFPDGEPLAGAVVQAYRWQYTPFGRRLKMVRTVLTDDLGEYRLFWLSFGEYIVSASYNRRAQRAALGGRRFSPNLPDPDDGYTTVFYGGAFNASEAQSIRVTPAVDSGNSNLILSDTPRFSIRGQVVSATPLPPDLKIIFLPPGTDFTPDDAGNFVGAGPDGTFEVTGVSEGVYVMLAFGGHLSSTLVPIHVGNSNVEKVSIPLAPTVTVNGRVLTEGMRTDLSGVKVTFVRSNTESEMRIGAIASSDGTFTAADLGIGEYDVWVDHLPSGTYTRSIRFGGIDVLNSGMRIGGEPSAYLDVTLSAMAAIVQGRVVGSSGDPSPGVQIVLVPEPRFRRRPDRYVLGSTDASGNFQLTPVPPGQYKAFAFEQIEPGAQYAFAYDPQVSERLADRAVPVNVNQVRAATLELRAIPAAESPGGVR